MDSTKGGNICKTLVSLGLAMLIAIVLRAPVAPKNFNKQDSQPKVSGTVQTASPTPEKPQEPQAVETQPPEQVKEATPVVAERPPEPAPLSDKQSLMQQAGIPQSEWNAVDYIVSHESSWNHQAQNPSGAFGLCQALPASKMASVGGDYMTNPVTQLKWCSQYAQDRYQGWWGAFAFWSASHWW